jgi:hypothetical protein
MFDPKGLGPEGFVPEPTWTKPLKKIEVDIAIDLANVDIKILRSEKIPPRFGKINKMTLKAIGENTKLLKIRTDGYAAVFRRRFPTWQVASQVSFDSMHPKLIAKLKYSKLPETDARKLLAQGRVYHAIMKVDKELLNKLMRKDDYDHWIQDFLE